MNNDLELVKTRKRLVGLDILKILAMLFIIIHHVSKHGLFYNNVTGFSKGLLIVLNALFLASVNIFIYISAYLIVKKGKTSFKHYFSLYLQIVFYSLLTYLISCLLKYNNLSISTMIKCFLPITCSYFWFCREYLLLYIISPLLLKIVQNLNKKEYNITLCFIFGLLLYCNVLKTSIIPFNFGFNFIWFAVLFLIAGYQYKFGFKIKKVFFLISYVITSLLSVIIIIKNGMDVDYTNLITVINTISLFNLLYDVDLKINSATKVLNYISTCTLGIYLLHDGAFIQQYLYQNIFKTYKFFDKGLLYFFVFVIIIFCAGLIVETIRKIIFKIVNKLKEKIKVKLNYKK